MGHGALDMMVSLLHATPALQAPNSEEGKTEK